MLKQDASRGLILKLDFEKAFDTINWDFLWQSLENLGFGCKLIGSLKRLFHSSKISVLVNGSPTSEFKVSNGVRRGDPLSPLLFNLAVGVLNSLIKKARALGLIQGIQLGNGEEHITHLQYADDTIIFLQDDLGSVCTIKRILQSFQLLSGLKINYNKSMLYSCSQEDSKIEALFQILGCSRGSWPLNFLGDQIGLSSRKKCFWNPLLSKVKRKFASWKLDSLNQADRLSLIKSTINSLPTYWFSLHKVPVGIC